ncbi:MAG TPA: hypothetical protein VHO47_02875 [Candidatus Babeliales bacterium]|nr:hypothetical protein [Candidatus Babeliales bacterium]
MRLIRFIFLPIFFLSFFYYSCAMENSEVSVVNDQLSDTPLIKKETASIKKLKIVSITKEQNLENGIFENPHGGIYYTAKLNDGTELIAAQHRDEKFCIKRTDSDEGIIISEPIPSDCFDEIKLLFDQQNGIRPIK